MKKENWEEEFEKNGMVKALKDAQGFEPHQYKLIMRLFDDLVIPKLLQQERERIIKIVKNQKRDEYGGCYECGNEMYNQAIEDIIENLNQ